MKKTIMLCGVLLAVPGLCADPKPQADVHLTITDDLPRLGVGVKYNGIFSITNTGSVAFSVVTNKEWSTETTRFYQDGNVEAHRGAAEEWKNRHRREVTDTRHFVMGRHPEDVKTLQPGESVTFESICAFYAVPGLPSGNYKAEMYLGENTWVPVRITPTLGTLFPVTYNGKPTGDFYYSQEGTNQYLYVKTEEGKFKRVGEMKLGSKPLKEKTEDTVTFVSPDGATKKLTRDQAREIIREREQQN